MPFEYGPQLAHSKAGCEQFVLPQFRFQIIGCDLSSLRCTWQWAGYNQIRSHLEACEKFRHVAHFFFTKIGQRALIIRFLPIRPIGLAMTKEIKLHVDLYVLLHDSPLRSARSRIGLPQANATEESVSVVPQLNSVRQLVELLGTSAAKNDVIGNKRLLQQQDRAKHFAFPFFFTELFHSRLAKVILDDVAVTVRQIAELQREHVRLPNQC